MVDSQVAGASFVVAFNPTVVSSVQDRTLQRIFRDALFPRLLFRGEATPEMWPVNLGANQTFTRTGLIRATTRPLIQTKDPIPQSYDIEQWEANAQQWAGSIDTHMPTSYVTLASVYLRNVHQLGLHGGQSLNRVTRDKLFNAYTSGNTVVRVATAGAIATVPVVSLSGFTRKLFNGRPAAVSPTNPLPIVIITGGVATAFNVIGFTSDFPGDEIHSGVLTLDAVHGALNARDAVLANNRARVINSGGSVTIDGIATTDQLTFADLRAAVSQLRTDNTPVHEEDQTYHCHLDPVTENQVFGDNEFQRLNQSLPDYVHYRELALAQIGGITFYRNTESPLAATVDQDPNFGFTFAPELLNTPPVGNPVTIHRSILTGRLCIEEKFLDESRFLSEAGIIGRLGEFAVTNNGITVMAERIRLILRAPLDRLQQLTSASWSFSGDWPIPTDATVTTSPQDYKRAVCVQSGSV